MFSTAQPFRLPQSSEQLRAPDAFAAALAQWVEGFSSPATIQLSGGPSSGKATFAFQLCLAALRASRAVGWIDARQGFQPLAALEAGEPLDRLLVAQVPDGVQAMRAADLLLSCPGAVAVAVIALPPRYYPPDAALVRLQRLAERSATHLIFIDEQPERIPSLGACVSLRLRIERDPASWISRLEITRHKGGPTGPLEKELHHEPNRLRLHCSL